MTPWRIVLERVGARLGAAAGSALALVDRPARGVDATGAIVFAAQATLAGVLLIVRLALAILDSVFELIGFALGAPLFRLPRALRAVFGAGMLAVAVAWSTGRPRWVIAAVALLLTWELLAALRLRLSREPRLLLAPARSLASVALPTLAWDSGLLATLVAFMLVRRAFAGLVEGLAACAAAGEQRERDRRVAELAERLLRGGAPAETTERLMLYLRPFHITGALRVDPVTLLQAADETAPSQEVQPNGSVMKLTHLFGARLGLYERATLLEATAELEMLAEAALRGAGLFVALGRPGEALGAGRLPTADADWQAVAQRLIEEAALYVLVPSAHEGTAWEVRQLVQRGYLGKCCVLMPPLIGKGSYADAWRLARAALADVLPLPVYDRRGALLRIHPDGRLARSAPLVPDAAQRATFEPNAMAAAIQQLFPELPAWPVGGDEGWLRVRVTR